MAQQLVFMHHNYPSQFGPVIQFLLKNYDLKIAYFSQFAAKIPLPGVEHHFYQPVKTGHEENPYFFSRYFEQECASMHGLYNELMKAKLLPDLFISHVAFGNMGLLHVEAPEIPKIGFFELFYDPYQKTSESRPEYPTPKPNRLRVPLRNATQLIELEYCTKGYSPTPFQQSTYPTAYQDKLSVLFDGIDTNFYCPGEVSDDSELKRTWPVNAPIVTFVSRGLEAMRGFDIFMEVAHRVSLKRPDVHFVIAGTPKTHYGSEMINIQEPTFKEHVLKKRAYDLNRFHFLDWLSESALRDLFRLSACHFYWTIPFTLSWSLFQAMACGVIALVSDSLPTRDIVFNGQTGLSISSYELDKMAETMLEVLAQPSEFAPLRDAARASMVKTYSFEVCLPKLADFYLSELSNNAVKQIAGTVSV